MTPREFRNEENPVPSESISLAAERVADVVWRKSMELVLWVNLAIFSAFVFLLSKVIEARTSSFLLKEAWGKWIPALSVIVGSAELLFAWYSFFSTLFQLEGEIEAGERMAKAGFTLEALAITVASLQFWDCAATGMLDILRVSHSETGVWLMGMMVALSALFLIPSLASRMAAGAVRSSGRVVREAADSNRDRA